MDRQTIYDEFETNPIPQCPMWYNPQGKQKVQIVMHVLEETVLHMHVTREQSTTLKLVNFK